MTTETGTQTQEASAQELEVELPKTSLEGSEEEANPASVASSSSSSAVTNDPQPIKNRQNLEAHCLDYLSFLQENLRIKELFKLASLDQELHSAYYKSWLGEANELFKAAVRLKRRINTTVLDKEKPPKVDKTSKTG